MNWKASFGRAGKGVFHKRFPVPHAGLRSNHALVERLGILSRTGSPQAYEIKSLGSRANCRVPAGGQQFGESVSE